MISFMINLKTALGIFLYQNRRVLFLYYSLGHENYQNVYSPYNSWGMVWYIQEKYIIDIDSNCPASKTTRTSGIFETWCQI